MQQQVKPTFAIAIVKPDLELVKLVEEILEEAKSGNLRSLAGTGQMRDGAFVQFTSASSKEEPVQFLGWLRVLQLRFEQLIMRGLVEVG